MINKFVDIRNIIFSIFSTLLLFYFLLVAPSNIKIVLVPFFVCSISILLKNIFILVNKQNLAQIFNKIFIIGFLSFLFGFLSFACYRLFLSRDYIFLLFTIPFWLSGFYIIKKNFFPNSEVNTINSFKEMVKPCFVFIKRNFLITFFLVSGILLLFFGIKNAYIMSNETKNYITTEGYYSYSEIHREDRDGTSLRLIYVYKVDDKEYYIATDYGTDFVPEKNSIRYVKYNPDNPQEAVLVGSNRNLVLIFMGIFFILGSSFFLIFKFKVSDKFKGVYIGLIFLIIGVSIIVLDGGMATSLSEIIKMFNIFIIVPLAFIIFGICQIIHSLFFSR